MTNHPGAQSGCLLVGEYVDEAELPVNSAFSRGVAVRPQVVATYLDLWGSNEGFKEFTALLKDGRIVAVRGHSLKHWPATVAGDCGSYGIILRAAGEEVVVALFKACEVIGIFHGEVRSDHQAG